MNKHGEGKGNELITAGKLKFSELFLAGEGPVSRNVFSTMQRMTKALLNDNFLLHLDEENSEIRRLWKIRTAGGEGWQHLTNDLKKEMESLGQLEEQVVYAKEQLNRQLMVEKSRNTYFVLLLKEELERLSAAISRMQEYLIRLGQRILILFKSQDISEVILEMLKTRNSLLGLRELLDGNFSLGSTEVMDLVLDRLMIVPYQREDLLEMKEFFSTKQSVQDQVKEAKLRCMEDFLGRERVSATRKVKDKLSHEPFRLTIGETRENVVFLEVGVHSDSLIDGLARVSEIIGDGPAYPLQILEKAQLKLNELMDDLGTPADLEELERLVRMYKWITHSGNAGDYQQKSENFGLWKILERQVKYYREEQEKMKDVKRPPFLTVVK
jgi:hypothetical protein